MRKFLFILCLIIILGCTKIKKIEEDTFFYYQVGSDLPGLYGGEYRFVETKNGFKIEDFEGNGSDLKDNELFKNNEISILLESKVNLEYIYKKGSKEVLLHTCSLHPQPNVNKPYSTAFQIGETVYFYYYDFFFNLFVSIVDDGQLIEYKKMPLKIEDYSFKALVYNDYEMYFQYKNDTTTKYVFDKEEYIFDINDHVIVLKDYIFYSTYNLEEVTGTYIINRNTNETIQLDEKIDIYMDIIDIEYPDTNVPKIKNNSFVFKEYIDGKSMLTYGVITNNTFNKVNLPYTYNEYDNASLHDEKTIFLSKSRLTGNYDFYVIEIK